MKTLEKQIAAIIGETPDNAQFRLVAYELTHDGQGWSVNAPFCIGSNLDREEMLEHARDRWEIFKLNYAPRARVKDLDDTGYEEGIHELEVDCMAFLRIEITPI